MSDDTIPAGRLLMEKASSFAGMLMMITAFAVAYWTVNPPPRLTLDELKLAIAITDKVSQSIPDEPTIDDVQRLARSQKELADSMKVILQKLEKQEKPASLFFPFVMATIAILGLTFSGLIVWLTWRRDRREHLAHIEKITSIENKLASIERKKLILP